MGPWLPIWTGAGTNQSPKPDIEALFETARSFHRTVMLILCIRIMSLLGNAKRLSGLSVWFRITVYSAGGHGVLRDKQIQCQADVSVTLLPGAPVQRVC